MSTRLHACYPFTWPQTRGSLLFRNHDKLNSKLKYRGVTNKKFIMFSFLRREPGTATAFSEDSLEHKTSAEHRTEADIDKSMSDSARSVRGRPHLIPSGVRLEPVTVRGRPLATGARVRGPTVSTPPLRKLLFSATLTSNPQKLAGLDVINPIMYTAREVAHEKGRRHIEGSKDRERVPRGEGEEGDGKRPSQKTRRSNLDDIDMDGKDKGKFSTPATLEETYTVCDSQVRGKRGGVTSYLFFSRGGRGAGVGYKTWQCLCWHRFHFGRQWQKKQFISHS